jgi:undecaprenyl-diphosphatase
MSHRRSLASVLERLSGQVGADAWLLVSLLALALAVWAFVFVADLVAVGQAQPLDERLIRAFRAPDDPSRPLGPDWLPGTMRDITSLGSAPVLAIFVVAVAGALEVRRQHHAVALLLAATVGGILLNESLKDLFGRPRPELALRLTEVRSLSFPSGHAMLSAIIYLTLAALLTRLVEGRALRVYFVALAALLTLLVGLSRIYLGVHYPSDVLAGWAAGLAWALLCWTLASYLQRRGSVEAPK